MGRLLQALAIIFEGLVGPAVMLLYPLIASLKAIESPSGQDDKRWLTYWILYSLISLFELTFYQVLSWFPFWSYIKLLVCIWLVLPVFNGASLIYENYVRKHAKTIIGLVKM